MTAPARDRDSWDMCSDVKGPLATPKLCGRLTCRKQTGLLKTYEARWFVYSEDTGSLLYYKSPDDLLPIGEIDIRHATFGFAVGERPGVFQIRTSERVHILEAENRSVMMYWLQEMQSRRMQYFQKNATNVLTSEHTGASGNIPLSNEAADRGKLPHIAVPVTDVGQAAAAADKGNGLEQSSLQKKVATRLSSIFQLKKSECENCKALQQSLVSTDEDANTLRQELSTSKDVVRLLNSKIDKLVHQMAASPTAINEELKAEFQLSSHSSVDGRSADSCCREFVNQVQALEEQIEMMSETLAAKDSLIVSLSRQLDGASSALHASADGQRTQMQEAVVETSVAVLQDSLQAYELQNKFLNKEILELHELRVKDSKRDGDLNRNYMELEAKYYQLHSKYLVVLNELHKPSRATAGNTVTNEDREADELVSQLLKEAIESDTAAEVRERISSTQSGPRVYDRYGFLQENAIAFQAATFQAQSDRLVAMMKNPEAEPSLRVKWENFLVNMGSQEIHRSIEFKNLIRAGIPNDFRERVWNTCINFSVAKVKREKGPQYYQKLLSRHKKNHFNPVAKQIELDLPRTLPDNKHFDNPNADGMPKLRNVLLAYSYHNPAVGYCQGMNRGAAFALLFLSEEDAFWCMVAIVDYILPPDYYSMSLAGAQADQRVLKDILQEKVPQVASHMERFDLDISLFSFNWFLTLFVENVPIVTVLRIWDAFLFEGSKVLFRYAVAFFKYKEAEILEQCDYITINVYMRGLGEKMVDPDYIANIAFNGINPFMSRSISSKRARYLDQVRAELHEIHQLRKQYKNESSRQMRGYTSDDDDAAEAEDE